ncbi:MAG: pyridoxal-phosphate dependent enzyme [archaeon]|nr:pyridoxal-phosphate dependent enzyme [archaeon]
MESENKSPLATIYPGIKKIPWVSLIKPTPVEKLVNFGKELNFNDLWIKRDDLSNPDYGGNKPRKFEYLIADALKKGKKSMMTFGGIGSNHTIANSIFCKQFGLVSHIFTMDQPLTPHCRNHMLVNKYYGANFHNCGSMAKMIFAGLFYRLFHPKCYVNMPGGSSKKGVLGFVNAVFELKKQIDNGEMPEPDYIFVAKGSMGTSGGILLGCLLTGMKTKVYAINVMMRSKLTRKYLIRLAYKTCEFMREYDSTVPIITKEMLSNQLIMLGDFSGGEYGMATEEGKEAIDLAAKDGIILDTTYTGKAASAMIACIREKKTEFKDKTVLFWNTLNSVDLTDLEKKVDYHDLPQVYHQFFDGTIPYDSRSPKSRLYEDIQ